MQTFYRDDKADVSRFLFMSNDGDGEKVSRLNTVSALWYALTLEPVEVQNMLCVRIFEAVAIYGALLISTVYTIFGWRNKAKAEGDDTTLSAAFDCVICVAMISNVLLTLFASWFWMTSIMLSPTQENFLRQCFQPISMLLGLVLLTTICVLIGLGLVIVLQFQASIAEMILCATFLLVIALCFDKLFRQFILNIMPLEIYHVSTICRFMMAPLQFITKGGKNKLQTLASTRAMKLKMKYGIDKQQQGQYGIDKQQQRQNWESLDNLLRMAVTNLGRMEGSTISEYKGRLEKDWLTLVEHIQGRDVDFLNKYMPLLLAEEVHRLLKIESSEYCSSDHNDEA